MIKGIDPDKVQTLLRYLAKAQHRFSQRAKAEEVVKAHLKALRKGGTKKLLKQIDALERRLDQITSRQQEIVRTQRAEDTFHTGLKQKIEQLEKRLEQYLAVHKERAARIQELEQKVKLRMAAEEEKIKQLHLLEDKLCELEQLRLRLKKKEGKSKKLAALEEKINTLKDRLKALHAKHAALAK